jgi:hypothetical protein
MVVDESSCQHKEKMSMASQIVACCPSIRPNLFERRRVVAFPLSLAVLVPDVLGCAIDGCDMAAGRRFGAAALAPTEISSVGGRAEGKNVVGGCDSIYPCV